MIFINIMILSLLLLGSISLAGVSPGLIKWHDDYLIITDDIYQYNDIVTSDNSKITTNYYHTCICNICQLQCIYIVQSSGWDMILSKLYSWLWIVCGHLIKLQKWFYIMLWERILKRNTFSLWLKINVVFFLISIM